MSSGRRLVYLRLMDLQFPSTHPFTIARTQVMLPAGAFIRALPFIVNGTERLRSDASVMCADIVGSAYIQLVELVLRTNAETSLKADPESDHVDVGMFQHAWSIIDQLYALRLLLRSLGLAGPEIDAFLSATQSVHVLRNRMDHLDQRIPNIAASNAKSVGLFGSLSYLVSGAAVGSPNVEAFIAIRYAEPIRPQDRVASLFVPEQLRLPVGNFVLAVGDDKFDLDAAILSLAPVMLHMNERFETIVRTNVAKRAVELGRPESDLLAHHGAGLTIMLALTVSSMAGDRQIPLPQPPSTEINSKSGE